MKIPTFLKKNSDVTYVCREPFTTQELVSLLKLRYKVYALSKNKFLFPPNPYHIDVDAYDLRSIHFGVFECRGLYQRAIGYMRLITEHETDTASMVRSIVSQRPKLKHIVQAPVECLFPIFKFLSLEDATNIVERFKEDYGQISETGRFCLSPHIQDKGLAFFAVNSMVQASLDYLSDNGVVLIIVSESHTAMYRRFGFQPFAQMLQSPSVPERFVMMSIDMRQVKKQELDPKMVSRQSRYATQ